MTPTAEVELTSSESVRKLVDSVMMYYAFTTEHVESLSMRSGLRAQRSFTHLTPQWFDGVDLSMIDTDIGSTTASHEQIFFNTVDGQADTDVYEVLRAVGSFDVCFAKELEEKEDYVQGYVEDHPGTSPKYLFHRYRRAQLSEVRGLFPLTTGIVMDASFLTMCSDGRYSTMRTYYELRKGGKWWIVGQPTAVNVAQPADEQEQKCFTMIPSIALSRYYEWVVRFKIHDSLPSVSIPTDVQGARILFKDRAVPPDKDRRTALRHWVSSHYRPKFAVNEDERTLVLPFLRGRTSFNWNGFQCEVVPSSYDVKKYAEYTVMRQKTPPRRKRR